MEALLRKLYGSANIFISPADIKSCENHLTAHFKIILSIHLIFCIFQYEEERRKMEATLTKL